MKSNEMFAFLIVAVTDCLDIMLKFFEFINEKCLSIRGIRALSPSFAILHITMECSIDLAHTQHSNADQVHCTRHPHIMINEKRIPSDNVLWNGAISQSLLAFLFAWDGFLLLLGVRHPNIPSMKLFQTHIMYIWFSFTLLRWSERCIIPNISSKFHLISKSKYVLNQQSRFSTENQMWPFILRNHFARTHAHMSTDWRSAYVTLKTWKQHAA